MKEGKGTKEGNKEGKEQRGVRKGRQKCQNQTIEVNKGSVT